MPNTSRADRLILKPWFDRALGRAIAANHRSITWEDFDRTRMKAGKLERIADEISEGLDALRELEGDRDRLRGKLGMKQPPSPRPPRALKPGQRKLEWHAVGAGTEAA